MFSGTPISLTKLPSDIVNKFSDKLKNDDPGLHIESLNAKNKATLFSARLSDAERLLYTYYSFENQQYVILLEYLPTHDYKKAKYMKDAVLDNFLEKNKTLIEELIKKQKPEGKEEIKIDNADDEYYVMKSKVVKLSREQSQVSFKYREEGNENRLADVVLVNGGPGSGKTLLAFKFLEECLLIDNNIPNEEIIYVTESSDLITEMENTWKASEHYNPYKKKITFLTYEDLIKRQQINKAAKIAPEGHFSGWLDDYLNKNTKNENLIAIKELAREKSINRKKLEQDLKNLIEQELRIISGYTKDEYLRYNNEIHPNISTLFYEKKLREFLYKTYSAYQENLKENDLINLSFSNVELQPLENCGLLVVDECQDFSHLGLQKIFNLAGKATKRALFHDQNQTVRDLKSKFPFIESLAGKQKGITIKSYTLSGTYRCPQSIVNFANQILALKLKLIGGISGKDQQVKLEMSIEQQVTTKVDEKNLHWWSEIEFKKSNLVERVKASTNFSVVTSKEHYKEACERFGDSAVYTPEEIKGLEFENIILYRPLDNEWFKKANKLAKPGALKEETPVHAPKADQDHYEFGPALNDLYIGATRATKSLYIIQDDKHETENITHFLKNEKLFGAKKTQTSAELVTEVSVSSDLEWKKLAEEAVMRNDLQRVNKILHEHLNWDDTQIQNWVKEIKVPTESKLAANPPLTSTQTSTTNAPLTSTPLSEESPTVALQENLKAETDSQKLQKKHKKIPNKRYPSPQDKENFFKAIRDNKFSIVKNFLNNFDFKTLINKGISEQGYKWLQHTSEFDLPPLHFAAQRGYHEIVNLLLEQGLEVDSLDKKGYTALFLACQCGRDEVVKTLIQHHANLNIMVNGADPILAAVRAGQFNIVNLLLENGVAADDDNNQWRITPLMAAVSKGAYQIAQLLIEKGADINKVSLEKSVLAYAIGKDANIQYGLLEKNKTVRLLLQCGVIVKENDPDLDKYINALEASKNEDVLTHIPLLLENITLDKLPKLFNMQARHTCYPVFLEIKDKKQRKKYFEQLHELENKVITMTKCANKNPSKTQTLECVSLVKKALSSLPKMIDTQSITMEIDRFSKQLIKNALGTKTQSLFPPVERDTSGQPDTAIKPSFIVLRKQDVNYNVIQSFADREALSENEDLCDLYLNSKSPKEFLKNLSFIKLFLYNKKLQDVNFSDFSDAKLKAVSDLSVELGRRFNSGKPSLENTIKLLQNTCVYADKQQAIDDLQKNYGENDYVVFEFDSSKTALLNQLGKAILVNDEIYPLIMSCTSVNELKNKPPEFQQSEDNKERSFIKK